MKKGFVIVDYTTGETIGIFTSWKKAYEFCSKLENHKVMIDIIT